MRTICGAASRHCLGLPSHGAVILPQMLPVSLPFLAPSALNDTEFRAGKTADKISVILD
jgi:hypothetical protein